MKRILISLIFTLSFVSSAFAQSTAAPDRNATGGAQTLEDIMARQRGEEVDNSFRSDATGDAARAAEISKQLGTLGGNSDPELWRALRFGSADITASNSGPAAEVLIQDGSGLHVYASFIDAYTDFGVEKIFPRSPQSLVSRRQRLVFFVSMLQVLKQDAGNPPLLFL